MEQKKLKQELLQASDGLWIMSETDAAFEFVFYQLPDDNAFTPELIAAWDGQATGTKVETLELEAFFYRALHPHPDSSTKAVESAGKFKHLVQKLHELLHQPKAYKVGEISMPVYLVGSTGKGAYAGLKTLVVET